MPLPGLPLAGFAAHLRTADDIRNWNKQYLPGTARDYPSLVWLGATQVLANARLNATATQIQSFEGLSDFSLSARLESNRSYFNAESAAFFKQRELRLRGEYTQRNEPRSFVARTIWPSDFRLDLSAPLTPIAGTPQAIRDFVRSAPHGGARSEFKTQVIWQRSAASAKQRAGRPLLGFMLNGAQGDDDEAHGGHFALFTGRVGAQGEMHDWLVANYYTLDSESEKGIIAAMLPLDNYLADLNSGQAWYRPSYMLVATLREARVAEHLSSALARVFNQFYRHQFVYQHAAANCTGISVSTLRAIGWALPELGAVSWLKAAVALPVVSLQTRSLSKGKAVFDYLTEDQTRLFPALAFEQAGADLLQLLSGHARRALTPYEELLRQDVEEIMLVRIPQLPSSRAWGDYPVAGVEEYRKRLPDDPAQQKIVPVGPRPFPPGLKDPATPELKPLRSDYALAAYAAGLMIVGGFAVRALWRRWRKGE